MRGTMSIARTGLVVVCLASTAADIGARRTSDSAAAHHAAGVEFHNRRALDDASREYAITLALDPVRDPTSEQLTLVRRFAPRIYTQAAEPFALEDVAVVMHPDERLIAYHLFWDDDIDFPEDNDPCDHEVLWVQYGSDGQRLERVWTYFHGHILPGGEAALADAHAHGMRPRVDVQWGKHGTMPVGWTNLTIRVSDGDSELSADHSRSVTLAEYNVATFQRLSTTGRRLPDHPLGQRLAWPRRFSGTVDDFTSFTRLVDPLAAIDKTRMVKVSRWNSATLDQHFLAYNFRPKTEWPVEVSVPAMTSVTSVAPPQIEAYQLPPKSVFAPEMPRYPNAWFYVDRSLAPSYQAAVALVARHVRDGMLAREYFGPFSNPEGCDFEARIEHLQPWEGREARGVQHAHAFHLRYYHSALARQGLDRVTVATAGGDREFFRVAVSVHDEVEHANPHHADVERCPICGRTGEYADLTGSLVENVHDPLGLELLMNGTIRGETVRFDDYEQRAVGGVRMLGPGVTIDRVAFTARTEDRNTLRIGILVFGPLGR